MTDTELRGLFASLITSLRETNASIQAVNVRLAYTEGEVLANKERTERLEQAFDTLTELTRNMDARLDIVAKQQEASERRAEAAERRADAVEMRQDKADEAVASLSRTVERYINARSTNGNKS